MRIFKTIIPVFVALLLLAPVGAFAANVKISGKVIDSQGAPLPGVVLVGPGNTHAVTDLDGKFTLGGAFVVHIDGDVIVEEKAPGGLLRGYLISYHYGSGQRYRLTVRVFGRILKVISRTIIILIPYGVCDAGRREILRLNFPLGRNRIGAAT